MDPTYHFDAFTYEGHEYAGAYAVNCDGEAYVPKGETISRIGALEYDEPLDRSEQDEIASAHWAECGAAMEAD